ncbi:MAG TPA: hypothetical protein VF587_14300 [Solirubrobacteraceae bacterium]|jgi:hypothetical protein
MPDEPAPGHARRIHHPRLGAGLLVVAVVLAVAFDATAPAIVLMVVGIVLSVTGDLWDGAGPISGG